jgi:predicted Fe-Mo cluster-binding NifX family protein
MSVTNKIDCRVFAERLILNEMKIAVPTRDGKKIATSFKYSPYYKILNIKNGHIRYFNLLRNETGKSILNKLEGTICDICARKNLTECFCDCQVVIIRRIDHKSWDELGHMGIEVIQTDENDVDKSVEKYLKGKLLDKYNYQ